MTPKLGLVHIPKTAGTALAVGLGRSLDPEGVHLRRLFPARSTHVPPEGYAGHMRSLQVWEGTPVFRDCASRPWLAGHISAEAMALFERDFTFSVMRDRRMRLISLFRYGRWRWEDSGKTGIPSDISLEDWLRSKGGKESLRAWHGFGGVGLLVAPRYSAQPDLDAPVSDSPGSLSLDVVAARLDALDWIYFPQHAQEVADNLARKGLAPRVAIPVLRETMSVPYKRSDEDAVVELLCAEGVASRLEGLVVEAARARFGASWTSDVVDEPEVRRQLRRAGLV